MIFTASDVSLLSQSLHRWEIAEYIFEGLVIIACAGELLADLGRKCLARAHRDRIERFSTILLVAALSMELICLVKTNELSGNVIGSLGDKAEEADRKAKKALNDSALAVTQSGQAVVTSKGAVETSNKASTFSTHAVQRAEDAEHETTRLRDLLADRQLTDAQAASIIDELRPYARQEFDVVAYWDSKESMSIAERVNRTLQAAGWKFLPLKGFHALFGGVIGIQVWRHPDADEQTKAAAAALVAALLHEGLQAEARLQNPENNPKHNTISLSVGAKR